MPADEYDLDGQLLDAMDAFSDHGVDEGWTLPEWLMDRFGWSQAEAEYVIDML